MGGRPEDGDDSVARPATEDDDKQDQSTEETGRDGDGTQSLFDRYEQLTVVRVVVAVALLGIAFRLFALGARSAHWDEARVAYWSYYYADTGSLAYYWEEHGPLAQLASGRLFELFGVTDFAARAPVAIVGGLFPLSALLFREHLRRDETVALAAFLATNAVLLYFSRFMRSDVLVAAFMFTALGLLVRFYDTRRARYLLAAGVFFGLGFGSKENAIIYVLTWLGATALVVDQALHSPASETSGLDRLRTNLTAYRSTLKAGVYRVDYAIGFVLSALATMVLVFAPRGRGLDGRLYPDSTAEPTTLASTLRNPTELPALVDQSLGDAYSGYVDWFLQSEETTLDTYVTFLTDYVTLLLEYAPAMVSFALIGIVLERYARRRSRALVMFMAYCGVASLIGYPLGSHIQGDSAWLSVHVVVPLLVPASVGLAWGYRTLRETVRERSLDPRAVVVVVILLVGLWGWFVPAQSVYVDDTAPENELVQYAQPHSDLGSLVDTMEEVTAKNDGTDVLLYYGEQGESFDSNAALVQEEATENYAGQWQITPPCSNWATTQPLNWYFAVSDVEADCERSADALVEQIDDGEVPIVVTTPDDSTVSEDAFGDSYVAESYYLRNVGQEVVVYTERSWTDESE